MFLSWNTLLELLHPLEGGKDPMNCFSTNWWELYREISENWRTRLLEGEWSLSILINEILCNRDLIPNFLMIMSYNKYGLV